MKIGRNDPCFCGSGKKYKKCCYLNPSPQELEEMKNQLDQLSNKRKLVLTSHGVFIDFCNPTQFRETSVWALGSRLYPNRPPEMTFHEFLIDALAEELGRDWIKQQKNLTAERRHFIIKCHDNYLLWRKLHQVPENLVKNNIYGYNPDGWSKALLSLAFDIACIIHVHEHVPQKIINRLRLPDSNYQGARYEIAIAAIFARMGCKLEFLDETFDHLKTTPGHCELIVTDYETDTTVGVEAKSKVRKGVLHEPGTSTPIKLWANVTGPYRDAISQKPGELPFFVFVDINLPPSPNTPIDQKPWIKEILKGRKKTSVNKPDNPDPCTGIVFTNYSYHYQSDREAHNGEYLLILPKYPRYSTKEIFLTKLHASLQGYSYIPNLNFDGTISPQ